jgi:hypothetical protein
MVFNHPIIKKPHFQQNTVHCHVVSFFALLTSKAIPPKPSYLLPGKQPVKKRMRFVSVCFEEGVQNGSDCCYAKSILIRDARGRTMCGQAEDTLFGEQAARLLLRGGRVPFGTTYRAGVAQSRRYPFPHCFRHLSQSMAKKFCKNRGPRPATLYVFLDHGVSAAGTSPGNRRPTY